MNKTIEVTHVTVSSEASFETFIEKFEAQLGRHDGSAYQAYLGDAKKVEKILEGQEGSSGFMLFMMFDHGAFLNIKGAPRKARQYILGNPLFASEMTKYDIRAALYAPLRVLIYSDQANKVTVEYDLALSLFGQFGNNAVNETAKDLDKKMTVLIDRSFGG